jgi:hypothetical protein
MGLIGTASSGFGGEGGHDTLSARGVRTRRSDVRHATPETVGSLEPLLAELRQLPGLKERKPGNFQRGSGAFLHFHEDPEGVFADLRVAGDWELVPVSRPAERRAFVRRVRQVLAAGLG